MDVREEHQLVAFCIQPEWGWTHNLGMCPGQESKPQPSILQVMPNNWATSARAIGPLYLWFCFPQFQWPMLNSGPKILNRKFQKQKLHKFEVHEILEHDEILSCLAMFCLQSESPLCPAYPCCLHWPPVNSLGPVGYQDITPYRRERDYIP